MKKLLFLFVFISSISVAFSQNVQFSQGDRKKTVAFNGGVYIAKLTYIGRISDTTSAAISTLTGAAVTAPTREGAIAYDSTDEKLVLYRGSTLKFIDVDMVIIKEATIDFGSVSAQTSADSTVTVTGAAIGDNVTVSVKTAAVNLANTCYTAFVSAANTVTVRLNNYSASGKDPASGVFKILVHKN